MYKTQVFLSAFALHRRISAWVAWISLMAAPLAWGTGNSGEDLDQWIRTAAGGRADPCLLLLEGGRSLDEGSALDELQHRVINAAGQLALREFKNSKAAFTYPEDRLLIELALSPRDLPVASMSSSGQSDAKTLLDRKFSYGQVASVLIGASPVTDSQGIEILRAHADADLRKLIEARDRKDWPEFFSIFEQLPPNTKALEFSQQQLAFALNRRKQKGDEVRAEKILLRLIELGSVNGETYGLLGRVYVDRYQRAVAARRPHEVRLKLLDKAIAAYRSGFLADPRDYYPGINLVKWLLFKDTEQSRKEARGFLPSVRLALERLGDAARNEFWSMGTLFSLSCVEGDWQRAREDLLHLLSLKSAPWMLETTRNGLQTYQPLYADSPTDQAHLEGLIEQLNRAIEARKWSREAPAPSTLVASAEPDTEGQIRTGPIDLDAEARKVGFGTRLDIFKKYSKGVMGVEDLLRKFKENTEGGYLLGLTKDENRPVYEGVSRATRLETWWRSYERFGLTGTEADHTARFMNRITSESAPVVFLVPRNLFSSTVRMSFTATEMDWLLQDPERRTQNVIFVFGAYELLRPAFVRDVMRRNGQESGTDIVSAIIRSWQHRLSPEL